MDLHICSLFQIQYPKRPAAAMKDDFLADAGRNWLRGMEKMDE